MSETDPVVAGPDSPVAVSAVDKNPVKRRPLERALVWTLIAVLAVLASAETWSRYSFQRAYDHLGSRLEVGDERSAECLDAADVKAFLGDKKPSRTEDYIASQTFMPNGATHLEVYSWFTLNPVYRREMFVYYDAFGPARKKHPQVLAIQAFAEEFIPLVSQREQQYMDQLAINPVQSKFNRLPEMPGRPAGQNMPGRGSRRRGARDRIEPAVQGERPADNPGQDGSRENTNVAL